MNVVILKGRLTTAPEVKKTTTDLSVCRFSIAVDRKYGKPGEDKVCDFIPCVAWRSTAEFMGKYFVKGQEILLTGSLEMNKYKDKDGVDRTAYSVNVENVEFCGKKDTGAAEVGRDPLGEIAKNVADAGIPDDDLPF